MFGRLIDRIIRAIAGDDPLGRHLDDQYGNDVW